MTHVSDNVNPTIDEVREWGYDENKLFLEQDEDLILHSPEYIQILLELGGDDTCPKKNYCFSILQHYAAIQLSHRTKELKAVVFNLGHSHTTSNKDLENWKTKYLLFADLVFSPRTISAQMAEEIARFLTVGDFSKRDFERLGGLNSGFIEFMSSTSSYKEYFYINPQTSKWTISRHTRLTKV